MSIFLANINVLFLAQHLPNVREFWLFLVFDNLIIVIIIGQWPRSSYVRSWWRSPLFKRDTAVFQRWTLSLYGVQTKW